MATPMHRLIARRQAWVIFHNIRVWSGVLHYIYTVSIVLIIPVLVCLSLLFLIWSFQQNSRERYRLCVSSRDVTGELPCGLSLFPQGGEQTACPLSEVSGVWTLVLRVHWEKKVSLQTLQDSRVEEETQRQGEQSFRWSGVRNAAILQVWMQY